MSISNSNSNFNVNLQCQFPMSNSNFNPIPMSNSNFNPIPMSNSNINVKCQCQMSMSNVNIQCQCQCQCQFQFPSQCQCQCQCQCQFQFPSQCQMSNSTFNSIQINVNLPLGQQKWSCLFSDQVNDNLPSIGILLSQTFNLYLFTGQVPGSIQKRTTCTYLYTYASGQTASSICRTVCTQLILCYRSNGKFDLKNSLYPSLCFVIGQTTSSF
jgi:hypothetical protein